MQPKPSSNRRRGLLALAAAGVAALVVGGAAVATTRSSSATADPTRAVAQARERLASDVRSVTDRPVVAPLSAWKAPKVPRVKRRVKVVQPPPRIVYVAAEVAAVNAEPVEVSAEPRRDDGDEHQGGEQGEREGGDD